MIDEHILREQQDAETQASAEAEGNGQQAQPAAFSIEDRSKNPMSAVFGK